MFEWMYPVIIVSAGLIILSIMTSLIAFRFGAPLLLIFLGIGLLVGEDGLGLEFSNTEAAYAIGTVALTVILFDSGFGTSVKSLRQASVPSVILATLGVALTTGLVGAATYALLDFTWLEALLMGAIVSSTDAAAVFFLLRVGGISIKEKVRSTLEVESGSNDPMAIFLTIVLIEMLLAGMGLEDVTSGVLLGFLQQMGLGVLMGVAGGYVIVQLVNRLQLDAGLYPVVVLASALLVFAATGQAGGSGFLAAYVAGLYAGNSKLKGIETLRRFQDGMSWLAQIGMFLVLGLLATPSQFLDIALPAALIAVFLIFLGRPIAIWLCLLPFRYQRNEIAFVSWVGLRGAVSILLAILPWVAGLENGELFFNIAFVMVLISLLVQGWTIRPMARWLGLIVPPQIGPVERVGLELPGNATHELIVYRVVPDSPVALGERIPRWARPSLVVRNGQSMRYQYAGRLQAGDYVYLFIGPRYTRLLDRLFASPAKVAPNDKDFFGDFRLDPQQSVLALREAYDASISDVDDPATTIADYMMKRLGGRGEAGDRVACGAVELIVREVDEEGRIADVGLSVEPGSAGGHLPFFPTGRELIALLRQRLGHGRKAEARQNEARQNVAQETPGKKKGKA